MVYMFDYVLIKFNALFNVSFLKSKIDYLTDSIMFLINCIF